MSYIEVSRVQSVWSDGSEDYGNDMIGPSLEDQTADSITKGPSFFIKRLLKPIGVAATGLVAAACSSGPANVNIVSPTTTVEVSPTASPSPEPSVTPRPTHTAIAVGGNPLPDQEMDKIAGKVSRGEASEADIDRLNAYVKAQIDAQIATATAQAKVSPTRESSPTPKPSPTSEATSTPEEPKLGTYDVFVGERIMFTTLPDGGIIFFVNIDTKCSNPTYYTQKFVGAGRYTLKSSSFSTKVRTAIISGALIDTQTFAGRIVGQEYSISYSGGKAICPAVDLPFTANKKGEGRSDFLKEYAKAWGLPSGTTEEQIQTHVERYAGRTLPQ